MGFCPLGPKCTAVHLKNLLNPADMQLALLANFPQAYNMCDNRVIYKPENMPNRPQHGFNQMQNNQLIVCFRCGKEGHKSTYCQEEKVPYEQIFAENPKIMMTQHNVTCFECGQKGHYANSCPLKTLSKQQQLTKETADQFNAVLRGAALQGVDIGQFDSQSLMQN